MRGGGGGAAASRRVWQGHVTRQPAVSFGGRYGGREGFLGNRAANRGARRPSPGRARRGPGTLPAPRGSVALGSDPLPLPVPSRRSLKRPPSGGGAEPCPPAGPGGAPSGVALLPLAARPPSPRAAGGRRPTSLALARRGTGEDGAGGEPRSGGWGWEERGPPAPGLLPGRRRVAALPVR